MNVYCDLLHRHFSTCHRKDADPDVQVPPSNHCDLTAVPGALLLFAFGLPGCPDPRAQHDQVEHPYGRESWPVYRHLHCLRGKNKV